MELNEPVLLLVNDIVPLGRNPVTWAVTRLVEPTATEDGASDTVVVVVAGATVNALLLEIDILFISPEYVAVIDGVPVDDEVYDTEHAPLDRVHELVENVPDGALNDTVPVGENPVTWAVTVVVPPAVTDDGLSCTWVVGVLWVIGRVASAELATLFTSPE